MLIRQCLLHANHIMAFISKDRCYFSLHFYEAIFNCLFPLNIYIESTYSSLAAFHHYIHWALPIDITGKITLPFLLVFAQRIKLIALIINEISVVTGSSAQTGQIASNRNPFMDTEKFCRRIIPTCTGDCYFPACLLCGL